jgi:hypothetical protein
MARIAVILLPLLITITVSNLLNRENVIFEKINEIGTTRSQWLVGIQLDFNPYGTLLRHIEKEIVLAQKHIFYAEADPNTGRMKNVPESTLQLLKLMTVEFLNFKHAQQYLTSQYHDMRTMGQGQGQSGGRHPRALVPIIGKGLGWLFGVLTEADIESLRVNIRKLAKDQQIMRHVVNESLTILKEVRGQVRVNRKSINTIIDDISAITDRLDSNTKEISLIQDFLELYAMLDRANAEIRELLNIARDHLQVIRLQLSMLSLGHLSSSVISPSQLKEVLMEIKGNLGTQFTLPFDPEYYIWNFYKTITCTTLMEKHHIIIVIAIPLIDATSMYEVYQIHNIAVPYRANQTTILAKYKLETEYIAVDLKRTKFAALSAQEAVACSNTLRPYCTFSSPAYSVLSTKMCVMHLFSGDRQKIKQYCQEMVLPNEPSPQAEYLRDGHWLITSEKPLTLNLLCNTTQSTIVTKPPLDIITLNATCAAHDAHFSLLPYYHKESKYNMTDAFTVLLQKYSTEVVHVWEPFDRHIPSGNLTIPPKLKDMKEVPLDKLISELKDYNLSLEPMDMDYDRYILYGLVTFLFVVMLLAFLFRKKLLNCLNLINHKWSSGRREGEISRQSPPGVVLRLTPTAPTGGTQFGDRMACFRPDRALYPGGSASDNVPTSSTNTHTSTEVTAASRAVLTQNSHGENVQVGVSASLPRLSSVYPELADI